MLYVVLVGHEHKLSLDTNPLAIEQSHDEFPELAVKLLWHCSQTLSEEQDRQLSRSQTICNLQTLFSNKYLLLHRSQVLLAEQDEQLPILQTKQPAVYKLNPGLQFSHLLSAEQDKQLLMLQIKQPAVNSLNPTLHSPQTFSF